MRIQTVKGRLNHGMWVNDIHFDQHGLEFSRFATNLTVKSKNDWGSGRQRFTGSVESAKVSWGSGRRQSKMAREDASLYKCCAFSTLQRLQN